MNNNQLIEHTIGGLHEFLLKEVLKIPKIRQDTPILDIGCGTGAWLETLAYNGFRDLVGIDVDTNQFGTDVATCSKVNLNIDANLGLEDKKFGLITAIEVIEHLENPGRFFNHVTKHLDEDGYFLMTTPNIHSLLCRFRFFITGKLKQFDDKGDKNHICPVFLTILERILPRHQLEIEKKWHYPLDGVSITSRKSLIVMAAILSMLLPNTDPGDVLCLLIRKQRAASKNS